MECIEIVEDFTAGGPPERIFIDEDAAMQTDEIVTICSAGPDPAASEFLGLPKVPRKRSARRQQPSEKRARPPPPSRSAQEVDAEFRNLASQGILSFI